MNIDVPSACAVATRADCPVIFFLRLDDTDESTYLSGASPIAHGSSFPFIGVYPRGETDGNTGPSGSLSYGWNTDGRTSADDLGFINTSTVTPGWTLSVFDWNIVLFGVLIIVFLIFEPLGMYGIWVKIRNYWKRWPLSY